MAKLAGKPAGAKKEAQGHADIGRYKHVSIGLRENKCQAQENSIASLVGSEAVVVGEGSGVCAERVS